MPLTVTPTRAEQSWTTEYASSIELVSPMLIDNHKDVMPTARIMKMASKEKALPPNEEFGYNMITEMQDTYGMAKNQVFRTKSLDPVTRQTWTPEKWYSSAPMNDFDIEHYKNSGRSYTDLAEENLQAIRSAMTWRNNYDLFSRWDELDEDTLEVDLHTVLAAAGHRNPPRTTLRYNSPTERPYSIPMLIRKHVTGHTIGGVHSSNTEWQPLVWDSDDGDGSIVVRATTGINIDVVTNDHLTDPSAFSLELLQDYLSDFQKSGPYELYGATPSNHFIYLVNLLRTERRRTPQDDKMSADLGIDATLTLSEFKTTFYVEPMLDWFLPNSLFFFDTDCMFPAMDAPFNPRVVPWERIPGTNQYGTFSYYNGQNICPDRVGLGAMHGYGVTIS